MMGTVPSNPWTGAPPKRQTLCLEVWAALGNGEYSPRGLEGKYSAWRDDFREPDLHALLDECVRLAQAASLQ